MSYKAQQWVLEQTDISGLEKWVLFMLAYRDSHDEPHGCYPSVNRMARDCGVNRRTVMRILNRLVKMGKIHSEPRRKVSGDRSSNLYTFPQVWQEGAKGVVAPRHYRSGVRRPGVVTPRHPNLKDLTNREPSRAALPIPIEENRKFQNQFLNEMKRIAGSKSL